MTHSIVSESGGNAPEISDVHVVAVYDPNTGTIFHVHNVTVYKGGRSVTEKEAIDTALARASEAGHRTENLEIKLSKNPVHGRSPHKIDLTTGDFMPVLADGLRSQRVGERGSWIRLLGRALWPKRTPSGTKNSSRAGP
jgi:hypothetical protein